MEPNNNPIQQRIDMLVEKWTVAINTPDIKIVRVLGEHDDEDMLNTLFEYMLAVDSDQEDFVIVLQEPFSNHWEYGKYLLEEIEEEIDLWNTSKLPEGFPFDTIEWKPDYSLGNENNATSLLVENLNNFANYLIPEQNIKVSIVIRMYGVSKKSAYLWLSELLKLDLAPHLVFGVSDLKTNAVFDKISREQEVYTLYPELDMDEAMEQLTALGDPAAKETPYRISLVKLMNGVKNRKPAEVSEHSKNCLTIAAEELKNDPNWLAQIVTVYTILYNDQVGYKDYDRGIYFADKAVEAALHTPQLIPPEMSNRLIGQTHMGRGSLYCVKKKWDTANKDFEVAKKAYHDCDDYLMETESYRLCGWTNEKMNDSYEAEKQYIEAYNLLHKLPVELIKGSTFPLIVQKLLDSNERQKHISNKQMDQDLRPIWGNNWHMEIKKVGKFKRL